MAYFEDLSRYTYHHWESYRLGRKNVGWLGEGHEFRTGKPTEELLNRLWSYCKISVTQMRGVHDCEFCKSEDLPLAERNNEKLLLGTSEIRVFSTQGEIYAAPTLIYHYVSVHHYEPPDEFVRALTEGPQPESREYFDRLKESMTAAVFGVAATAQNAPAGDPVAKPGTRHELDITSDSAPGWLPSTSQDPQVLVRTNDYFSALDQQQYQRAYAMMTEANRNLLSLAQFIRQNQEFHERSGPLVQRNILRITWTKDPAAAPFPGVLIGPLINRHFV